MSEKPEPNPDDFDATLERAVSDAFGAVSDFSEMRLIYLGLRDAGFTENEALKFLAYGIVLAEDSE